MSSIDFKTAKGERLLCVCSYLVTNDYGLWRPQDHNASKFVKAVKGETLNGYAYVPVLGVRRHLNNANLDDSVEWLGDMVASYMQEAAMEPPFVLVPVPNSSITTKSSKRGDHEHKIGQSGSTKDRPLRRGRLSSLERGHRVFFSRPTRMDALGLLAPSRSLCDGFSDA